MLSDVVGERIAEVRRQQGLTREDLAKACNDLGLPEMTANAITNIETGRRQAGRRRREINVDEFVVIATALKIPPVLLVYPVGALELSPLMGDLGDSDPWMAAEWFCGEGYPPVMLPAQNSDAYWRELAAIDRLAEPLVLYRQHRDLVRAWKMAGHEGDDDVVDLKRESIELQLASTRRDMRYFGLKALPYLPEALAHLDGIPAERLLPIVPSKDILHRMRTSDRDA